MCSLVKRLLVHSNKINYCYNSNYSGHYVKYFSLFGGKISFTGRKVKDKDNVPDNFELIYRTTMNKYVISAHAVAIISTVIILPAIGYNKIFLQEFIMPETNFLDSFLLGGTLDTIILTSSFFFFNTAIIYLSGQIPLRIYFDSTKKRYIAIFRSLIPFGTTKVEYSPGDVKILPSKGILPWKGSRYSLKMKKIILLENSFRTSADYENMINPSNKNE